MYRSPHYVKAILGSMAMSFHFGFRRSSAWHHLNGHPLVSFNVRVSTVNDKILLWMQAKQTINNK